MAKPYDPLEPMTDDEAKDFARAFHCRIEVVETFTGKGAERHARRLAAEQPEIACGKSGLVVQGMGKHRGAFLACRLVNIPYKSMRRFKQ